MSQSNQLQHIKNQWIFSHINVPYPTEESVKGFSFYQSLEFQREAFQSHNEPLNNTDYQLIWVDFHKLTVWFAQFYIQNMGLTQEKQQWLLGLFTQFSYEPEVDTVKPFFITYQSNIVECGFVISAEEEQVISDLTRNIDPRVTQALLKQQGINVSHYEYFLTKNK